MRIAVWESQGRQPTSLSLDQPYVYDGQCVEGYELLLGSQHVRDGQLQAVSNEREIWGEYLELQTVNQKAGNVFLSATNPATVSKMHLAADRQAWALTLLSIDRSTKSSGLFTRIRASE